VEQVVKELDRKTKAGLGKLRVSKNAGVHLGQGDVLKAKDLLGVVEAHQDPVHLADSDLEGKLEERGPHHVKVLALKGFNESDRLFQLVADIVPVVLNIQANRDGGPCFEVKDFAGEALVVTVELRSQEEIPCLHIMKCL